MSIEICHLCKAFGDKKVFDDFSCNIEENMTTAVMGYSGCGKTTLVNILTGLEKADSGEIKGMNSKKISMVFQENRLCENLSSVSNIKLVTNRSISRKSIITLLSSLGLENCINQPVKELSGGMKRRVSLARALMADYDVLILDEPFKGLDAETKNKVISVLKDKTINKTVILITHDKTEAEMLNANIISI